MLPLLSWLEWVFLMHARFCSGLTQTRPLLLVFSNHGTVFNLFVCVLCSGCDSVSPLINQTKRSPPQLLFSSTLPENKTRGVGWLWS